ncbi:MAG: V-type ATP synthase subunit A, partial [Methanomicrobiales archaeon]|nr:V-type ATP synthase subunit A [Methanomicrobiales archaeon]
MTGAERGRITRISGNMVTARFETPVMQNEVAYILHGTERLKAEIIRVRGDLAELQVYEATGGLSIGVEVEFTGELLSVELGPGLLGQIFDGLQNPLPDLARQCGFFLKRGVYLRALDETRAWEFTPAAKPGDRVRAGDRIGSVPEGIFTHHCMVPFAFPGTWEVESVAPAGRYTIRDPVARLKGPDGKVVPVFLSQHWPVKIPIRAYIEKLMPTEPLVTKMRLIDSLFPVARGGTYCIPGPFGSGKTVLQQLISRHAEVDVVVIAACGERAGEVVETLKTFPEITDPRTGRPLSDRTVIICNTSSMPVAARESSVYTAVTIAEYYRQMGLHVLLLADSTSRWAQAMREMSGRLEEIPGEEAFPAYLESHIASFYERAGVVRLNDGTLGSVTIGGAVSPAGGNFDEPVTQATLKV